MQATYDKLKRAISFISPSAMSAVYCDGAFMFAYDGRVSVGVELPEEFHEENPEVKVPLKFVVDGKLFEKALAAYSSLSPKFAMKDDTLVIKPAKGRSRATIKSIPEENFMKVVPDFKNKEWFPVPDDFIKKLLRAAKFVEENHVYPWMCGVTIFEGNMYAASTHRCARIEVSELRCDFSIPMAAMDYLAGREKSPNKVMATPDYVAFKYNAKRGQRGRSWVRIQRLEGESGPRISKLLEDKYVEPTWKMEHEFKDKLKRVLLLAEDCVYVGKDRIWAKGPTAEIEFEVDTGVDKPQMLTPRWLEAVVDAAEYISFYGDRDNPICFKAEDLIGILSVRTQ